MKKLLCCVVISFIYCGSNFYPLYTAYAQQKPAPPYADWSLLAFKKTKNKYPNAHIVDYLHIGKTKENSSSVEKFKFWLKDNQREFGVIVTIEFENSTARVLKVTFEETKK